MIDTPIDLNELTKKFGALREVNPEGYDQIKDQVFGLGVTWYKNIEADASDFPFIAEVNSQKWKLRLNNFPDEPMYTLFINDLAILSFDDKPDTWVVVK